MEQLNLTENVDTLFRSLENFTQKEGIIGKPVTQGEVGFARTGDIALKAEVIRIRGENAELQTDELTEYVHRAFEHAVELEVQWTGEVLDGIDGINIDEMIRYVKYRANKMAGMLGIESLYPDTTDNVMPWIKAYADNFTETKTDFFEMRNASYKKTNLDNGFDDL